MVRALTTMLSAAAAAARVGNHCRMADDGIETKGLVRSE